VRCRNISSSPNSFAAPFVSDLSTAFEQAENPVTALTQYAARYRHPAGLYAAAAYASAEAYHKGEPMLARWLSNHARATMGATMVLSHGPGKVEVDGRAVTITQPKKGKAEPVAAAPEDTP
jgi:hypothetical protein